MNNIKLSIAYDGKDFYGWQKNGKSRTVEGVLQEAIEKFLQSPVTLQAASRTDAGVHANEQIVNFFTSNTLHLDKFQASLNRYLPKDLIIKSTAIESPSFHPTLDNTSKEYRYFVCANKVQEPIHRHYSWHFFYKIELEKILEAIPYFIGKHNFKAFCNTKTTHRYSDFNREIYKLHYISTEDSRLCFCIEGNHFLYKMVRNIIGTLMYIGAGKMSVEQLPLIFSSQQRLHAGITAPAHGLFLHRINYPKNPSFGFISL